MKCHYCGGNCPNEPEDSGNLCDGFAGDIDNLYKEELDQRLRLRNMRYLKGIGKYDPKRHHPLSPGEGRTNKDSADAGRQAVVVHMQLTRDMESEDASDVLTNLLHHAHREGWDLDEMLRIGLRAFEVEAVCATCNGAECEECEDELNSAPWPCPFCDTEAYTAELAPSSRNVT